MKGDVKQTFKSFQNRLNTAGSKVGRALTVAGNIANVGKKVFDAYKAGGIAKTGLTLLRAIVGNEKGWYTKYVEVNPAVNEDRPMDPLFNKSITLEVTNGAVCRFIDVNMEWTGYSQTYMFDQIVSNSFQKLRMTLKSNLPYKQNKLKTYFIKSIALAIIGKMLERNIQWNLFTHPSIRNFQLMWSKYAPEADYGVAELATIPYLVPASNEWSATVADYELMRPVFNNIIRLPDSLGRFISHYFGSVFIDSEDNKNDQYIRNIVEAVDWAEYDETTDTITYSKLTNLVTMTPAALIEMLNKLQIESGMMLADLAKSGQLTNSDISAYGDYIFAGVYDPTYLQALINAYTSPENVTGDGYIRLDRRHDADDDLTQFIFMGALQQASIFNKSAQTDQANVPAITVRSMTLKYDSDVDLKWPAGLSQANQTEDGFVSYNGPVGITLNSNISADTYVNVNADSLTYNISFGYTARQLPALTNIQAAISTPQAASLRMDLQRGNNFPVGNNAYIYVFVPLTFAVKGTVAEGFSAEVQGEILNILVSSSTSGANSIIVRVDRAIMRNSGSDANQMNDWVSLICSYPMIGLEASGAFTVRDKPTPPVAGQRFAQNVGSAAWSTLSAVSEVNNVPMLTEDDVRRTVVASAKDNRISINYFINRSTITADLNSKFISESKNISIGLANVWDTVWSGAYLTGTTSNATNSVSVNAGFTLISGWVADQFDAHLPIRYTAKTHVVFTDSAGTISESIIPSGSILIKEAYVSYYYNILDLVPTLYNMFTSLFETVDINKIYQKEDRKAFDKLAKRSRRQQKDEKPSEEISYDKK